MNVSSGNDNRVREQSNLCSCKNQTCIGLEWLPHHDEILRSWKKQAAINLWLALASKYRYDIINNWLTYPCIIISALTSIGIIGMDNIMWGKYAMSGLTLFSAILSAINKHYGAAEKSQEFYMRSKDYYSFIRELDYLLNLDVRERPMVYECLTRLRAAFDRIVDLQMEPPLEIIREYEKKFKPLEMSILGLQGEVITDDNDTIASSINDGAAMGTTTDSILTPPSLINKSMIALPKQSLVMMPYQLYTNPVTSVNPHLSRAFQSAALSPTSIQPRASIDSVFARNYNHPGLFPLASGTPFASHVPHIPGGESNSGILRKTVTSVKDSVIEESDLTAQCTKGLQTQ